MLWTSYVIIHSLVDESQLILCLRLKSNSTSIRRSVSRIISMQNIPITCTVADLTTPRKRDALMSRPQSLKSSLAETPPRWMAMTNPTTILVVTRN